MISSVLNVDDKSSVIDASSSSVKVDVTTLSRVTTADMPSVTSRTLLGVTLGEAVT